MILNCTCFRVRRLSRQFTQLYDAALRPTGLRVTQFSLLSALHKYGSMTVSALAQLLGSDTTSMSRALSAVVAQGWVTVGPGEDRRSKSVTLTFAGLETLRAAEPYWHSAQHRVANLIGAEGQIDLDNLLELLFNKVSKT